MRNLRSVVLGSVVFLGGVFLANWFGTELRAQQQTPTEAQSWEIHTGRYNNPGEGQDDTRFYVVRHNRMTGETQLIGCEDRDGCTQLRVEIQD